MKRDAPYLEIAHEIRESIVGGQLGPGDAIPSTREITRRWGVAMATATKVISALRDEGLVETRPGAKTVVRQRDPSSLAKKAAPAELGRGRIIRTAIALADREGLAVVSMRRVATELGVATMSLYRHVSSKEALLLAMLDVAHGDELTSSTMPAAGIRERLESAAYLMWTVFKKHPWASQILSLTRPQAAPSLIAYGELILSAFKDMGFDAAEIMNAQLTLVGHIRGTAINLYEETVAYQDTGITNDEWTDTQVEIFRGALESGKYPVFKEISQQSYDYDFDNLFEFGLQRLLDGFVLMAKSKVVQSN